MKRVLLPATVAALFRALPAVVDDVMLRINVEAIKD